MRISALFIMLGLMFLMAATLVGCETFAGFHGRVPAAGPPPTPEAPAGQMGKDQVFLQRSGIGLFVSGLLTLAAGIFFAVKLGSVADYLRSGGATGLSVGAILMVVAIFFKAFVYTTGGIILLVLALALIGGGLFLWLHRTDILPYFGKKAPDAPLTIKPPLNLSPLPA